MKGQKGITLISLTIYIIVMAIVVGIVATISTYFYTNQNAASSQIEPLTEYTKFNSFFVDEINHEGIQVLECKENYIAFNNGVQYTFVPENKGIYRNRIKISKGIQNCTFNYTIENGRKKVTVNMQSEEGNFTKQETYTLKN